MNAKEKLELMLGDLKRLSCPSDPVRDGIEAIEGFLRGDFASLDHAFGFKRGRGAPKKSAGQLKHFEIAKAMFVMRAGGPPYPSWAEIHENLLEQFPDAPDERDLQDIFERYSPEVSRHFAALIADRIGKADKA